MYRDIKEIMASHMHRDHFHNVDGNINIIHYIILFQQQVGFIVVVVTK